MDPGGNHHKNRQQGAALYTGIPLRSIAAGELVD